MKIREKIVLKNLGECEVLCDNYFGDTLVRNIANDILYFVTNLNKKRQDEEYMYDRISMYPVKITEAIDIISPMYKEIVSTLEKTYNVSDQHAEMLIKAYLTAY